MSLDPDQVAEALRAARHWVVGRELDLLRMRVREALDNAIDNEYLDFDSNDIDPDDWASDLAEYSSDMEQVPQRVLRWLIAEALERGAGF